MSASGAYAPHYQDPQAVAGVERRPVWGDVSGAGSVCFNGMVVLPAQRMVVGLGWQARIGRYTLRMLLYLIAERHRVVSRAELMRVVWQGRLVHPANIDVQMHTLRRLLRDNAAQPRMIATHYGSGFRFISPIGFPDCAWPAQAGALGANDPVAGCPAQIPLPAQRASLEAA